MESQDGKDWNVSAVNHIRSLVMSGSQEEASILGPEYLIIPEFLADSSSVAQLLYYVSISHTDTDSAFYWMNRAEDFSPALSFDWRFFIKQNLMYKSEDRGDFQRSVQIGNETLKEARAEADSNLIVRSTNNLGYSYDRMKDYRKAISYYEESLKLLTHMDDPILMGRTLGLIGIAYDELLQFDKANEYNLRAIEKFRTSPEGREYLGTWLSNLGNTYTKQGELEKAEKSLLEALEIKKDETSKIGMASTSINLGKVYLDQGRPEKALHHLNTGMELAKSGHVVRFQSEAHNYLSRLYTLEGDAKQASYHLDRYHLLNDSLINADKIEQIANMQVKYETEKQVQANEILAKENEILSLERDRQKGIAYGSLLFLALALISILFGYRAYRNRQKSNLNAVLIKEREKGLKVMLKSIEDERQRIAKDLHDGVGQQMTALKLQYNTIKSKLGGEHDKELDEIGTLLAETGREIRSVSHQMMPRALMELGLIPALEDMLSKSLSSTGIGYHFESLGKKVDLEKQTEVGLYRIAQELVNNVIKHAKAKHIEVQILFRPNALIMTIEDDGVGMERDRKEGIGLLNILSRLNALKGEARYEDASDHGTVALIRIPLDKDE